MRCDFLIAVTRVSRIVSRSRNERDTITTADSHGADSTRSPACRARDADDSDAGHDAPSRRHAGDARCPCKLPRRARLTVGFPQISAGFGAVKRHAAAVEGMPPPGAVDARAPRRSRQAPDSVSRQTNDAACAAQSRTARRVRSNGRAIARRTSRKSAAHGRRATGCRKSVERPRRDENHANRRIDSRNRAFG